MHPLTHLSPEQIKIAGYVVLALAYSLGALGCVLVAVAALRQ
jgi:hypothetical protein